MKITRSNYIYITPENSFEYGEILKILELYCVHANPKFESAKKGFYNREPKIIKTYTLEQQKNERFKTFKIYKGHLNAYNEILNLGLPLNNFKDERVHGEKIDINLLVEPRDAIQKRAIDEIKVCFDNFGYCCLSAVPAAGKTYMAVNLMSKLKTKTLVIVDMTLLIDQFVESITSYTDIKEDEIGIIMSDELKINEIPSKKIYLATIQTLTQRPDLIKELQKHVGFVVVDEVHVASTDTFQTVIPMFKPKYQLGLSGSHERDDQMEFLTQQSVGPIASVVTLQDMIKEGSVILPTLRPIFIEDNNKKTLYSDKNNADFREDLVNNYYKDPETVERISRLIMKHYDNGDSQLLICKENEVVDIYKETLYRKIFTEEEYLEALKFEVEILDTINQKKSLIEHMPLDYFASDTYKKRLESGTLTKEKYEDKAFRTKQEELKKINKVLSDCLKIKWYESEILDKNKKDSLKAISGQLKRDERNKIINDTNAGVTKIVIATTVMDKAISINRLNVLYLLFSTRERANTIQRVGRISRKSTGKTSAIVYDIIYDHYMSVRQFFNRNGKCRFNGLSKCTQMDRSITDFINYIDHRYTDFKYKNLIDQHSLSRFKNIKEKYVIKMN